MMYILTGGKTVNVESAGALIDFLGGGKSGVVKIAADVELVAPAPFALSADGGEENKIPWVFSTFDLDRMSERIDPTGWDISQYLKNPVVQWAHRFDIPAIGRAENVAADENGLRGFIVFNSKDFDAFGWSIGERVKAGVLRAGSVGFRPIEIEIPGKKDSEDGTMLIFRKQELLEFSVCNVPANPYALASEEKELTTNGTNRTNGKTVFDFWGGFIGNGSSGQAR